MRRTPGGELCALHVELTVARALAPPAGWAHEVFPLELHRSRRRDHPLAPAVVKARLGSALTVGPSGMAVAIRQQGGQSRGAGAMHAGAKRHFQGFQVPFGLLAPGSERYLEKRLDFARDFLMNSSSRFFSSSLQPAASGSSGRSRQISSLSEVSSALRDCLGACPSIDRSAHMLCITSLLYARYCVRARGFSNTRTRS